MCTGFNINSFVTLIISKSLPIPEICSIFYCSNKIRYVMLLVKIDQFRFETVFKIKLLN